MIHGFLRKEVPVRLLIMSDIFDASYNVFLNYSLKELSKKRQIKVELISGKDSSAEFRKREFIGKIKKFKPSSVLFLRYSLLDGGELLNVCKEEGIRSFYFIDDDFFALAEGFISNILVNHTNNDSLSIRSSMLTSVDTVLCSTEMLKDSLDKRLELKNSIAPFFPIFVKNFKYSKPKIKTIGYMGSKGHKFDLQIVVPSIVKLMNKHPDLRFETFGSIQMPEELKDFGSRVSSYSVAKSYEDFLEKLAALGWSAGLAPVESNKINMCKAFTKFIEYTSTGIPVIASDFIVYQQIINSENGFLAKDNEWLEKIEFVLNNDNSNILANAKKTIQAFTVENQADRLFEVLSHKEG